MAPDERVRAALTAAISGPGSGLDAADRLCHACVEVLTVDGASLSLMHAGASQGTVAASGDLSRRLDELQFTFGEGPCYDSMRLSGPVVVADLQDPAERRWPAYSEAVLVTGVRAIYALPVSAAAASIGVLDLFRSTPGLLSEQELSGGLLAARLATQPLLDLLGGESDHARDEGISELDALERVEVYQATGMIMGQLDCGAADALVRLRAHAFSTGRTASEVAWLVVERQLVLEDDERWHAPGVDGGRG